MKKRRLPKFNKKIKLSHLIIVCLIVALISAAVTYFTTIGGFGSQKYYNDAKKFIEIEKTISDNYIGEVNDEQIANAAASAMVKSIGDKWSYYMSADEYEAYKLSSANEYQGIGISVKRNDSGEFEIFAVEKGSPAEQAGITNGMQLVAVEDETVKGKTIEEVSTLIRSKLDTDFYVTVADGKDEMTVKVACKTIYRSPVSSQLLDGNIGYIRISNFEAGASENAKKAIEQMINSGAESFIFDVRDNPGGLVKELVSLLDYILPDGDLFVSVDKDGNEKVETSDKIGLKNKMVVLVNGNTYSAAEFFAAALQEYNWATVVGEHTTGKARSQITVELSDGSAVHISSNKYLTPKRVDLAEVGGVNPDIAVAQGDKGDTQLEAAITALG